MSRDADDPFAMVMTRQAEYHSIAAAYDTALQDAHTAGHGNPEIIQHLKRANEIGPAMLKALERYQAAVALLMESLHKK